MSTLDNLVSTLRKRIAIQERQPKDEQWLDVSIEELKAILDRLDAAERERDGFHEDLVQMARERDEFFDEADALRARLTEAERRCAETESRLEAAERLLTEGYSIVSDHLHSYDVWLGNVDKYCERWPVGPEDGGRDD